MTDDLAAVTEIYKDFAKFCLFAHVRTHLHNDEIFLIIQKMYNSFISFVQIFIKMFFLSCQHALQDDKHPQAPSTKLCGRQFHSVAFVINHFQFQRWNENGRIGSLYDLSDSSDVAKQSSLPQFLIMIWQKELFPKLIHNSNGMFLWSKRIEAGASPVCCKWLVRLHCRRLRRYWRPTRRRGRRTLIPCTPHAFGSFPGAGGVRHQRWFPTTSSDEHKTLQ